MPCMRILVLSICKVSPSMMRAGPVRSSAWAGKARAKRQMVASHLIKLPSPTDAARGLQGEVVQWCEMLRAYFNSLPQPHQKP